MTWNKIKWLISDMKRKEARARSLAARDREMPKMRKVLADNPAVKDNNQTLSR